MPTPPPVDQVRTPRALLDVLVSFPTVSRDSNLALVDWVEAWLSQFGIESHRDYDATGSKASLWAQAGPMVDGAVVLSGHTDVVPVEGQDWATDPFTVVEQNGRLYGRGTADMKGFDALALWAMSEAARLGVSRPLQIALSRDEEIGCLGAPPMLAKMAELGFPKASAAIIGEPTEMACVTGHKGGTGYWITVRGHEVHSSLLPQGVSAIMEAAEVIAWANAQNRANAEGPQSETARLFDPPFTTLHTGRISGGTADNITAGLCEFGLDFRCVPDDSMSDWATRLNTRLAEQAVSMKSRAADSGFDVAARFDVPALRPETNGVAEALVRRLTGDNGTHVVSYGTEAGQFQAAGYSAVVCGPGNIHQAHQPNEFIEVDQFERGADFMRSLTESLL